MINDKYLHNMAVEFFVSALTDEGDRAHKIAHTVLDEGPQFSHDFDASLFYLIHVFTHFITANYSGSKEIISELCTYLKHRELTADCSNLHKMLGKKKPSKDSKYRKTDRRNHSLVDDDGDIGEATKCPMCGHQFRKGEERVEECETGSQYCIKCVVDSYYTVKLEDFFGAGSDGEDKFGK